MELGVGWGQGLEKLLIGLINWGQLGANLQLGEARN